MFLAKSLKSSLPLFATLFVIFVLGFRPINNTDIWFHLKVGEDILKTGKIPTTETYSHTAYGEPWVDHSWLFEVLTAVLYQQGGFAALLVLKMLVLLLLFFLYFDLGRRFKLPGALIFSLLVFFFIPVRLFWVLRPHIFSFLFLGFLMFILIRVSYQGGRKGLLLTLPPVFLLWANFHASVLAGVGILGIWYLDYLFKNRRELRSVSFYCLLSPLASLLNPNFYKEHLYFFTINPSYISKNINEWMPVSAHIGNPHLTLFIVLSFLVSAVFLFKWLRRINGDFFEISLVVLLTFLAYTTTRHVANYSVVVSLLFLKAAGDFRYRRQSFPSFALLSVLTLFALGLSSFILFKARPNIKVVDLEMYPSRLIEKLKANFSGGNLYNSYELGGFLIFSGGPQFKVFIDGRWDPYIEGAFDDYAAVEAALDWKDILELYDVSFVITPLGDSWVSLGKALEESGDWILLYWDDHNTAFAKKGKAGDEALLKKVGYPDVKLFNDSLLLRKENLGEVIDEYKRVISEADYYASSANRLGYIYLYNVGDRQMARYYLELSHKKNSYFAPNLFNLGALEEAEGNFAAAVKNYKEAIKVDGGFAAAYKNLGVLFIDRFGKTAEGLKYLASYRALAGDEKEKEWADEMIDRLKPL